MSRTEAKKKPAQIHVLAHSLKRTMARRRLTLADLPRFVVGEGFAGLEISDRQLAGRDRDWLDGFSQSCRAAKCALIVDINVDFTAAAERIREQEIAHAERMIDIASRLGASAMRICIGGQKLTVQKLFRKNRGIAGAAAESLWKARSENLLMRCGHLFRSNRPARLGGTAEKLKRAIACLKKITPIAGTRRLRLGIENHWGISGDPENIVRIVTEVGSPYLGTCPDTGNFPRRVDPQAALTRLAPSAVILHAKSYAFQPDGEEKRIDYQRVLTLFRLAGFSGPITVEYEGLGNDFEGCRRTRDLILKHW